MDSHLSTDIWYGSLSLTWTADSGLLADLDLAWHGDSCSNISAGRLKGLALCTLLDFTSISTMSSISSPSRVCGGVPSSADMPPSKPIAGIAEPVVISAPDGWKPQWDAVSVRLSRVLRHSPLATLQIFTISSSAELARRLPSTEKQRACTQPSWPTKIRMSQSSTLQVTLTALHFSLLMHH